MPVGESDLKKPALQELYLSIGAEDYVARGKDRTLQQDRRAVGDDSELGEVQSVEVSREMSAA